MNKRNLLIKTILFIMCLSFTNFVHAEENNQYDKQITINRVDSMLQKSLENSFGEVNISNNTEWIAVYDIMDTKYAYYVPLYDTNNDLTGFSVVSDINGDNKVLVSASGIEAAKLASNINNAVKQGTDESKLIYDFPNAFYLKSKDAIFKITLKGDLVNKDTNELTNDTVKFLEKEASIKSMDVIEDTGFSKSETVYGELDDWKTHKFVPVSTSSGNYYGGYQGWLTDEGVSEFWANRSCGVTAASNMFYYLSQNVSGKSDLYTKSGITKSEFSSFQKDVYEYISPEIWGIPTIDSMISQVKEYAESKEVSLKEIKSTNKWNETNVRNYIATGLNSECPVLLLTWNSPIEDLSMHWVTITRIYNDGSDTKIVTSNWAGKTEYDFSTWVNGNSIYKAVIYFE